MFFARLTAPATLIYPAPIASGFSLRFSAVYIKAALTAFGVIDGFASSIRATAPETTGAAMLVPLRPMYWPSTYCGYVVANFEPALKVEKIFEPGAAISGFMR